MNDDHQKKIDDLKTSFDKVGTKHFEKGGNSKSNFVRKSFRNYNHRGPQRTSNGKIVRSIRVPKKLITTKDKDILHKWIPKGTRILETNEYGPKRIWVPKIKN